MQTFSGCVCIAQARIIAGFKRDSHICTIAFQPSQSRFLRLCVPYVQGRSPIIKRWSVFDFDGTKETLPSIDTRDESWDALDIRRRSVDLTINEKARLHKSILSNYKYEAEVNRAKESIGILIPEPKSLRFQTIPLSPHEPKDQKKLERIAHMNEQGLWFPSFDVKVEGKYRQDGRSKRFAKKLLAWDVYEALRKQLDPFQQIYKFRNPYMITGNTSQTRNGFMVIGVLSAPDRMIETCAINQQLSLV